MSAGAWLRFAELSLLAGWFGWRLYRQQRPARADFWVLLLAAGAAAGQFGLAAQQGTDALTSTMQIWPGLLASGYGVVTAITVVGLVGVGVWLARSKPPAQGAFAAMGGLLLVLAGASAAGAEPAVSGLVNSGTVAMSPTLQVPRSALQTPNPFANDPASAARGKQVYQQNCEVCHGINGDGNGPAGANLRIRPASFRNPQHYLAPGMDGAHFWVIQHGDGQTGGMPAWQGKLTDQQTWDVLNYVKTIAAGKPA